MMTPGGGVRQNNSKTTKERITERMLAKNKEDMTAEKWLGVDSDSVV